MVLDSPERNWSWVLIIDYTRSVLELARYKCFFIFSDFSDDCMIVSLIKDDANIFTDIRLSAGFKMNETESDNYYNPKSR